MRKLFLVLLATLSINAQPAISNNKGGQDMFGAYDVVKGWPKDISTLPGNEKWTWGAGQSVFAETPNRVFLLFRGELPNMRRPATKLQLCSRPPHVGQLAPEQQEHAIGGFGEDALTCAPGPFFIARQRADVLGPALDNVVSAEHILAALVVGDGRLRVDRQRGEEHEEEFSHAARILSQFKPDKGGARFLTTIVFLARR